MWRRQEGGGPLQPSAAAIQPTLPGTTRLAIPRSLISEAGINLVHRLTSVRKETLQSRSKYHRPIIARCGPWDTPQASARTLHPLLLSSSIPLKNSTASLPMPVSTQRPSLHTQVLHHLHPAPSPWSTSPTNSSISTRASLARSGRAAGEPCLSRNPRQTHPANRAEI